ncbi:MAG: DUF255 domain-containing protein [Deltaproteobacteria bacterium]|nr:MAG: DUF255 domain-containing protein [Deltaproteobacteria bacterium]
MHLALIPSDAGTLATYLWAFGQGVLVDLTPCVYPLIPITVSVFGAKGVSRGRALSLASVYVLGMALLYTGLGIAVSLTGAAFGTWLAEPVVVLPIAALLLALSASMFGAFELQLPVSWQNRLSTVGGGGFAGAFLMGLVSGLISAPCTGPVLLSLLAFIAKAAAEGSGMTYGASLLFVYALGMGTLFFAVALGASLLRPGPWMEHVKSVFGILLLVMTYWFLRPLAPALEDFVLDPAWGLWAGIAIAVAGILAGAVHLSFHTPALAVRVRKAVAVAVTTVGLVVVLNNVLYVPPMAWTRVETVDDLAGAVDRAVAEQRPILVDFAATWCLPCKELEVGTFHDPAVERELATRFELIKVDVTDPNDDQALIQAAFDSHTLPSVVLYHPSPKLRDAVAGLSDGASVPPPAARITTLVGPDEFLAILKTVD